MSQVGETVVEIASNDFIIEKVHQVELSKDDNNDLVTDNEIPVWLTKDLIKDALCKHLKDNAIVVKDLKVYHLGGKGESFASKMYRVSTYYYSENAENIQFISCILKTLPQSNMALEKLGVNHYNVQNKEMIFYERIIPKLEEILKTIEEDEKTFPTVMAVYYELDLIVLGDLTEKNFLLANRLKGLDMNHIKMTLRCLARMHAASVILHERDEKIFEIYDCGFYTTKTDAFNDMFLTCLESFTDEVASWKEWEDYEYYHQKLKTMQKYVIKNGRNAFNFDRNDFNALNHGDLWTTNIMFQYNSCGFPIQALLIDFQYSFYGSAVLDLHYLLYSSLPDKLRLENLEELIQFYYYEIKSFLERLDYDMTKFLSLHSFQIQVQKRSFYAFSACMLSFPVHTTEKDEDANFESLMGRDNRSMAFKRRIYQNSRFKQIAMDFLPIFDRRGILDLN
ncbi:hypothetical protein PVAND_002220 [Polypedilum vanderplanki]|uniref:CHK kinase-like domain-containing protein n=1 Tax=Polypedilum vanderplanki TaxID=319348 RepID=A0A9J6BQX6_POLVA|nr:hypothetical protein PVAND_002220 [Polypedilum vanderplanki]